MLVSQAGQYLKEEPSNPLPGDKPWCQYSGHQQEEQGKGSPHSEFSVHTVT